MSRTVHIESMTHEDLDEVLTLEQRVFPDPWTRAQFEAELRNPHAEILIARRVGAAPETSVDSAVGPILGYIAYWLIVDEIQILDVAVDPDARRQGIARTLLEHVVETGTLKNCITWSLEVRASNEAARRLYSNAGFQVVNTRKGYYALGREDALVMVRGEVPGA